jgi:hypothetical protein
MMRVDRDLAKFIRHKWPDIHVDIRKNIAEADYFDVEEVNGLTLADKYVRKVEGRGITSPKARAIIKVFRTLDVFDCPSDKCSKKMVCPKKEVAPCKAVHSVWSRGWLERRLPRPITVRASGGSHARSAATIASKS